MATTENSRAMVEMVKNNTALIRLTEKNKEALLNENLQSALSRKAEASEILANVKRLAPHWAKFLSLKEVAVDAAPLRLLYSLDSKSFVDSSAETRSYIAVSYCWRNPDWKPVIDKVCEPWNFCEPMVKALLKFRESVDEGIWVDEKCIDQSKEQEKQIMIGAMDVIYRSARRVLILLEDVQFSHEIQNTILKFSDALIQPTTGTQGLTGVTPEEVSVLADAYNRILSARWFSRAWCVHEFRIINHFGENRGIRPTFLVMGPEGESVFRVPVLTLINLAFVLNVHHKWHSFGSDKHTMALKSNFLQVALASPIQNGRGTTTMAKNKVSYMLEYIQTTKRGISEPQDRVQIALNLCDLPIACSLGEGFKLKGHREQEPELTETQADMKLLDTCYSLFSCIAMAASDFSVLASIGRPLNMDASRQSSRSWLRYLYGGELTPSHPEISPQCITSLEAEYIDLDLLFLPSDIQFASPAAQDFAKLKLVTPEIARRKIPITSYGHLGKIFEATVDNMDQWVSEMDDSTTLWLRDMLALALDSGVEWMGSAGENMRRDIMDQSFWLGNTQPSDLGKEEPWLRDAALEILSFGQQSCDSSVDEKSRQYSEEQILPIIRFLDLITDPRIRYTTFGYKLGRIVSPASEGPCKTLGMLRGNIPVERTFAVPVALSSKDYIVGTKVWALQRIDTEDLEQRGKGQAWRVVDKLALLFDPVDGMKDGVNGVRLERAQRVYGAPFWWEIPHHYGLCEFGQNVHSFDDID